MGPLGIARLPNGSNRFFPVVATSTFPWPRVTLSQLPLDNVGNSQPKRDVMSARARRRKFTRRVFRVFISFAFLLSTGPMRAQAADFSTSSGGTTVSIDRNENLRRANAATVVIKAQRQVGGKRTTSNGAGVIISAEGYILTANHVVEGYQTIRVLTVHGDMPLLARVILTEPAYDIALLKVESPHPLEVATLAAAQSVMEGREAVVIGNPLGMGQTVRAGSIGDVKTVSWDGHRAALRTVHATILKGNSGGGTFDMVTGELLGINVAKSSYTENTGYMVPVDRLVAILNRKLPIVELADSQEIFSDLGVRLRRVSLLGGKYRRGMLVTAVRPGSIADLAGWERGDVLVGLDKYQMVDQDAVLFVLRDEKRAKEEIPFILARGDATEKGTIDLRSSQAFAASTSAKATSTWASVK